MSDMPEEVVIIDECRLMWYGCFPCYLPEEEEGTRYIRADKYAELEATIAETVEKAAFVDEMCKALGVTFEALVNDDSVKAGIKEKDDA